MTPAQILLLSALLASATAGGHPSRWGHPQSPQQTQQKPPPPPAKPAAANNTTADVGGAEEVLTQLVTLIWPKVQAKLFVLAGNVGRAAAGATVASFKTGFKVPLAASFAPLDKATESSGYSLDSQETYPPGYFQGTDDGLRIQEVYEEDEQVTERKFT